MHHASFPHLWPASYLFGPLQKKPERHPANSQMTLLQVFCGSFCQSATEHLRDPRAKGHQRQQDHGLLRQ